MTAINQWREHLDLANHARTSNRLLKAELAALTRTEAIERVLDLIDKPAGPVGGMQIGHLIQAIPFYGETKMAEILTRAGVNSTPMSSTRKLRSLTDRQKHALTAELMRRQES